MSIREILKSKKKVPFSVRYFDFEANLAPPLPKKGCVSARVHQYVAKTHAFSLPYQQDEALGGGDQTEVSLRLMWFCSTRVTPTHRAVGGDGRSKKIQQEEQFVPRQFLTLVFDRSQTRREQKPQSSS